MAERSSASNTVLVGILEDDPTVLSVRGKFLSSSHNRSGREERCAAHLVECTYVHY